MSIQFGRKIVVDILSGTDTSVSVDDLHVSFNVEKTITKEYNSCSIEIYNLSKNTRDLITGNNQSMRISVGYGSNVSQIYFGELQYVEHSLQNTDVITKLEGVTKGIVEKNIAIFETENSNILDFIKRVTKEHGLTLNEKTFDKLKERLKDTVFANGLSFVGKMKDLFDEIAPTIKADWSLQDDIIQFIDKGGYLVASDIYLSKDTGLIGTPEKINDISTKSGDFKKKKDGSIKTPDKSGYLITSLLNPNINPAVVLKVNSPFAGIKDGEMIVQGVTHAGSNFNDTWFSKSRCIFK